MQNATGPVAPPRTDGASFFCSTWPKGHRGVTSKRQYRTFNVKLLLKKFQPLSRLKNKKSEMLKKNSLEKVGPEA